MHVLSTWMKSEIRGTCIIQNVVYIPGPLFEAVFLEYARLLINLGHGAAATYYCSLAGDKGTQLLKEVTILFGSD